LLFLLSISCIMKGLNAAKLPSTERRMGPGDDSFAARLSAGAPLPSDSVAWLRGLFSHVHGVAAAAVWPAHAPPSVGVKVRSRIDAASGEHLSHAHVVWTRDGALPLPAGLDFVAREVPAIGPSSGGPPSPLSSVAVRRSVRGPSAAAPETEEREKDRDVTWVRRTQFRSEAEVRQYLATRPRGDPLVSTTVMRVSVRSVDVPAAVPPVAGELGGGAASGGSFRELLALRFVSRPRRRLAEDDVDVCRCPPASGCGDACELRATQRECNPDHCPCGAGCRNQRLQRREYARVDVFDAADKGRGLRAAEDIAAGRLIMEYLGEVINAAEVARRTDLYELTGVTHYYFMSLDTTSHIDAHYAGNAARFINHSCNPNAATEKWDVDGETHVAIVALRDIRAGDEITFDYQFVSFGLNLRRCLCGEATCRGYLGAKPESVAAAASGGSGADVPKRPRPSQDDLDGDKKHHRIDPLYEIAYDVLHGVEEPYPPAPSQALPPVPFLRSSPGVFLLANREVIFFGR
jgi:hypothetical protein